MLARPVSSSRCSSPGKGWILFPFSIGEGSDEAANRTGGPKISAEGSAVSVWVIPTDEDLMIACHTRDIIQVVESGRLELDPACPQGIQDDNHVDDFL